MSQLLAETTYLNQAKASELYTSAVQTVQLATLSRLINDHLLLLVLSCIRTFDSSSGIMLRMYLLTIKARADR